MTEEKCFQHIYFRKEDERIWKCYNMNDEYLGILNLELVGRHMHWCWYQHKRIRMSPGCLQNVRDMQKELFNNRKREG